MSSEEKGSPEKSTNDEYARHLSRGAVVNALGLFGKLLHPVALLLATRLFGVELLASFLVAFAAIEMLIGFVSSGYVDATTLFASPHVDGMEEEPSRADRVYRVLGNGFALSLGFGVLAMALVNLLAPILTPSLFPQYNAVLPGLQLLSLIIVPRAITEISIAATKSRMKMHYDALIKGFLHPVLTIVFLYLAWRLEWRQNGLFIVYVAAEVCVALAALFALARCFAFTKVVKATVFLKFDRDMFRFALPQGFSLSLNNYLTHVDVLVLAALGASELQTAWYGTAARVTREMRAIRILFSSALAPVFARHRANENREAIEETLGRLSRWALTLVTSLAIVFLAFRTDVLQLFDAQYAGDDGFIIWLLLVPIVNCGFGLAGNALVFSGHTRVALANNAFTAILNTVLNLLLIPVLGLSGAALGTLLAQLTVSGIQLRQISELDGYHWRWRAVGPVWFSLFVVAGVVFAVGDPASFAPLGKVLATLGLLAVFALVAALTGHPEIRRLFRVPARK